MSDQRTSDERPALVWGHINVNVSNLERSIAFYELLGFERYRDGIPYLGLTAASGATALPAACGQALGLPAGASGRACIMQLGPGYPKLDLTEFAGLEQRPPPVNADLGPVRLCLGSRDLAADHARLAAEGVSFISEPQACRDGMAEIAVCRDPDGTLIELIEIHRDKWPAPRPGV